MPPRAAQHNTTHKTKNPKKPNLHRLEVGRGDAAHGALELAVPDLAAEAVGEPGRAAALGFCFFVLLCLEGLKGVEC